MEGAALDVSVHHTMKRQKSNFGQVHIDFEGNRQEYEAQQKLSVGAAVAALWLPPMNDVAMILAISSQIDLVGECTKKNR